MTESNPSRSGSPGRGRAVQAPHGMVVSEHYVASQVGLETLRAGGNAMDAAVATAFALAVVFPFAGNIAGGGFMVSSDAHGATTSFDFREVAPLAAYETMFLGADGRVHGKCNHEGLLSVGVPGTVAGLHRAHTRLGRRPWHTLLEPAIQLARDGFAVSAKLHRELEERADDFRKYPASAKVFLDAGGRPPAEGATWRQPDLAESLTRIQRDGPEGFYRGRTAQLLTEMMQQGGGLITQADLERYQAVERKTLEGPLAGYRLAMLGLPSSGGIMVQQMLNMLDGLRLGDLRHHCPLHLHLLAESMRRVFADRACFLGDPDFVDEGMVARLLDPRHAGRLRQSISWTQASRSDPRQALTGWEGGETTHFCVVDAERNAVSLTYTLALGYGCKIVVEGGGFLLNNEMGDFNPIPGLTDEAGLIGTLPNRVAPGKRPLSNMTPTIVLRDDRPVLAVGTPGGRTIGNSVLQVLLNLFTFGMGLQEAVDAPRIHHQWLPDELRMEQPLRSQERVSALQAMGHTISPWKGELGRVMAIQIDWESGMLTGAADARSADAAALGY